MLDFYLNTPFLPNTDYSIRLGKHSYLGLIEGSYMKGLVSDFDGVYNRPGSLELYKLVTEKLAEKNKIIGKRMTHIEGLFKKLRSPSKVPYVEEEIGKTFTSCGLKRGEYKEANEEAAEEFLKHSLTRGAKEYISRTKSEMGYLSAVVSGCYKTALTIVCESIGIPERHVYGTDIGFYGDAVSAHLMLGNRKVKARDTFLTAKNGFLEGTIGTRYGCYFVIDDDPILDAPLLKTGLNPSIIVGDFKRAELPFDVTTTCVESRENMLNLIPPMYRFEYGFVATFLSDLPAQHQINNLSCDLGDYIKDRSDFEHVKDDFIKKTLKILDIKEGQRLIYDASYIRNTVGRLLVEDDKETTYKIANGIFDYFKSYIPEISVERNFLGDLVEEYKNYTK